MSYWTYEQFKQTRKKINPVSKWWGERERDSRPMPCRYIDALVSHLATENDTCEIQEIDFTNM